MPTAGGTGTLSSNLQTFLLVLGETPILGGPAGFAQHQGLYKMDAKEVLPPRNEFAGLQALINGQSIK